VPSDFASLERRGGLQWERLAAFAPLTDAAPATFRAGILTTAGGRRIGVLRIGLFMHTAFAAPCAEAAQGLGVDAAAPCDEECAAKLDAATGAILDQRLAETLDALKARGAGRIVVDITNNHGGSDWVEPVVRILGGPGARRAPVDGEASGMEERAGGAPRRSRGEPRRCERDGSFPSRPRDRPGAQGARRARAGLRPDAGLGRPGACLRGQKAPAVLEPGGGAALLDRLRGTTLYRPNAAAKILYSPMRYGRYTRVGATDSSRGSPPSGQTTTRTPPAEG
jgi:hypothetical protein